VALHPRMIAILASSTDGWGLVREEEGYWLVRPPYRLSDRESLTVSEVERAILEEDFVLEGEPPTFPSWGDLCQELQRRFVGAASAAELEAAKGAAARILTRASEEQAKAHLAALEQELMIGQATGVEAALVALLSAPSVQESPEMVATIARLQAQVLELRTRLRRHVLAPQRSWKVADEAEVARTSAAIRGQGTLFRYPAA
jgi:hypothetical protein